MPRPRDIIRENLEAILTSEGVSESYGFGFTSTGGDPEEVTAIIVIGHVGDRFLVAVPDAVWNMRADKRHLPPASLEKPISVSVAGCTAAAREVAVVEFTVRLWVGWLKKSLRTEIDFAEPAEVQHRFVDEDSQTPCFPFATALMDVAEEKFQFVSKAGEEAKPADPDRLAALEERFSTLQDTLDRLLQMRSGGESGFVTASGAPLAAHSKMSPPAPPVTRASTQVRLRLPYRPVSLRDNWRGWAVSFTVALPSWRTFLGQPGRPLPTWQTQKRTSTACLWRRRKCSHLHGDCSSKADGDHVKAHKGKQHRRQSGGRSRPSGQCARVWIGRHFSFRGPEACRSKTSTCKGFQRRCGADMEKHRGEYGQGLQSPVCHAQCLNGLFCKRLVRAQVKNPTIHQNLQMGVGHCRHPGQPATEPGRPSASEVLSPAGCQQSRRAWIMGRSF